VQLTGGKCGRILPKLSRRLQGKEADLHHVGRLSTSERVKILCLNLVGLSGNPALCKPTGVKDMREVILIEANIPPTSHWMCGSRECQSSGPRARADMIRPETLCQVQYIQFLHPGGSIRSSRQHLAGWLKMPCGS